MFESKLEDKQRPTTDEQWVNIPHSHCAECRYDTSVIPTKRLTLGEYFKAGGKQGKLSLEI